jgi:DNA-binding MarR family transcriptional regulator
MTSEVLRKLESRRLLERSPDTTDARAKTLSVTDEGRSLARRAVEIVEQADADFLGAHSSALGRVLRQIIGSYDTEEGPTAQSATSS